MRWLLLLCVLVFLPVAVNAQQATPAAAAALADISITEGPTVVIHASGPLPTPKVGVLRNPDRIYIDFAGVSCRTLTAAGTGDVVTVRAAQHSLDPLVARVVIDLRQPTAHTINAAERMKGRIEISLAPAGLRSGSVPATKPTSPVVNVPPARKSTQPRPGYAARVEAAIEAAGTLRAVLHDLDTRAVVSIERLRAAEVELSRLRQTIDAPQPPREASGTHDLLMSACRFSATALELALRAAGDVPMNASSAAAGALLMMERAQSELAGRGGHTAW
jgi:hypothetical protein